MEAAIRLGVESNPIVPATYELSHTIEQGRPLIVDPLQLLPEQASKLMKIAPVVMPG
jgi:hypothetical protein